MTESLARVHTLQTAPVLSRGDQVALVLGHSIFIPKMPSLWCKAVLCLSVQRSSHRPVSRHDVLSAKGTLHSKQQGVSYLETVWIR
jgi:hypothetical protein